METATTAKAQVDQVASWRCDQLVGTGFAPALAAELADDSRYDLHALIELIERGCRPDLAARILTPLNESAVA